MDAIDFPDIRPNRSFAKVAVNNFMLFALGRAMQSLSNSYPLFNMKCVSGLKTSAAVPPAGCQMSVKSIGNDRLRSMGKRIKPEDVYVAIQVKSVHSGFRMLTGQLERTQPMPNTLSALRVP